MTLKSQLMEEVQTRQQRLRELRDMTQDRDERIRLDAELDATQITLSDLETMDEQALRERHARRLRARARRGGERAARGARGAGATLALVLIAITAAFALRSSRGRRAG
jgi:hypothetical protein